MSGFAIYTMALKTNDFVELDYSGRLKESGILFDTTIEEDAKKEEIHNPKVTYKSVIICLGKGQLLKGLEDKLIGKEFGTYTILLSQDDAFGKKEAKLLKLVPVNVFLRQGIRPVQDLQVSVDGVFGIIRTVNGGRCVVDFNHPLAGHEVEYTVKLKRIVTDKKEQVQAILDVEAHIQDAVIKLTENKVMITIKQLPPEPVMQHLSATIKETTGLETTFEAEGAQKAL